jgi:hypothetical protein
VQGRLREETLTVSVETECAHCGWPIRMTLDSALVPQIHEGGEEPLVFQPDVDWETFSEPNIIDAY